MVENSLTPAEVVRQQEVVTDVFKSQPLSSRATDELNLLDRQADRVIQRSILTTFERGKDMTYDENEQVIAGGLSMYEITQEIELELGKRQG